MSGSAPASDNEFSRLEVRESGEQIEVFVNGESIGSMGSAGTGAGAVGIIALGTGRFGFTNYRETPPSAAEASQNRSRTADGAASSADIVRLKRFDIVDNQGFGQPIVAISLLAPADWRLEGDVEWTPNYRCFSELIATRARLVSPDGRLAFEFFPPYATQWLDDEYARNMQAQALQAGGRGCPIAPPHRSDQFVSQVFVPGFRSGAQMVSSEENPAVAQEARAKMMAKEAAVIQQSQMQVAADAARVRLAYDGQGGAAEEWVLATTFQMTMPSFSASAAMQGQMAPSAYRSTYTENVYAFRAPRGELEQNERLLSAIVASIKVNPGWDAAVRNTINEIIRIEAQGTRAALDRIRQSSRRLFDDWNASIDQRDADWRRLQESQDRIAKKWSDAIRGTSEFVDAESNTSWDVTSGYEHVWKTPLDEFILTNDPNFNPNVTLNEGSWTQL